MTEALYYRQSGRIGFRGPVVMALGGLAGTIGIGAIYGYFLGWMHGYEEWWVQLFMELVLPVFYGFGVGAIVGLAARLGKVRNGAFVGWFGAAVGWVFWLLAWSEHSYVSPLSEYWWFSAIAELAGEGIVYDEDWTAQGAILYVWWTVEAVLIVFFSWVMAWAMVDASEHTFCEACEEWAEDIYWSPDLETLGGVKRFQAELEADPLGRLLAIPPAKPRVPGRFSRIRIQACPSCGNFFTLDVQKIKRWRNKEGEEESSQTVLVDNLLIDKPTYDALARHFPNAGKPDD